MNDLIAFLNARLDEDEEWAHAARGGYVLRWLEAARAILARYQDGVAHMEDLDYPRAVAALDQAREYEGFVLPNLAAIYSVHPDYRQEWAP